MKTSKARIWTLACASVLTAAAIVRAAADQPAETAAPKPDKSYTGLVTSINPKEHVLEVKDWTTLSKQFNFGQTCTFAQLNNVSANNATVNDLRIGEKVTVSYQDDHGVLIASRIEQEPLRFEGAVKTIDIGQHTLVLHRTALDKELQLPANCQVVLRGGKTGTLADIGVGNQVLVTYEMPGDMPTVRQIAQKSALFTGTLTAIDLNDNTLEAKAASGTKKFSVANNCAIVINGRSDGKLGDLKPNEKLVLSYDEIDGVNVVNRIAPAEAPQDAIATDNPSTESH